MTALTAAQISESHWDPSRNYRLGRLQGFMEIIVVALRSNETSLIEKIAVVACPILLGHLLGTLVGGSPFLAISIIVLPLTIWALFALQQLNIRESAALDVDARFNDIKEVFGGQVPFNRIPVLRTAHYIGHWWISPAIEANQMTHSVMRGADLAGRPFICFKVYSPENDEPFTCIFYQRYANAGLWASAGIGSDNFAEILNEIRALAIDRNHPHLRLA